MNSDTGSILKDLVTLPVLKEELGYDDERQVRRFLDSLGVPFVKIRRVRHYGRAAIRRAIDRHIAPHECSDQHETGPPLAA
jgi:hypothetical protein